MAEIKCKGCGKHPHEIFSVVYHATLEEMEPEEFIEENEGTYNKRTGLFWCDKCYIKAGMPLGKA